MEYDTIACFYQTVKFWLIRLRAATAVSTFYHMVAADSLYCQDFSSP